MPTYSQLPVAFVRGEGAKLWDSAGNEYLDFLAGIAVCGLGHCHPAVVEAICRQAGQLMHTSNLYYIPAQAELARLLTEISGLDKCFFCNSGAEANEAAVKLARKWAKRRDNDPSAEHKVITATGSFHGRTMLTVTATGQPKYRKWFTPLMPGFEYVEFGDAQALRAAIDERTCAVMLEPIQGESGVRVPPEGYLREVREICDERNVLLILDEVQTGLGRTGKWFAHQHEGVLPDIMTLAKSLAGGTAIGACLCTERANAFEPGDHASTFGGNHLACAAAIAVLETMRRENIVEHVAEIGRYFKERLLELKAKYPQVREVRGKGLMLAIELSDGSAAKVNNALFARRVLANAIGDSVLRMLPPLVVEQEEVDRFVAALEESLAEVAAKG